MNILLVYPKFPETSFWKFSHALDFIGKKASQPPLGLLTVASMLPNSWNLKLVNLNISPLEDKDVLWADYVFISAMNVQKASVDQIIKKCRELERITVAGGPLFTTQPELFTDVDHLVLNEAEVTLPDFLHDLESGAPKAVYTSSLKADLAETPVPRWDLVNRNDYATMCIQYSRGCPFNCDFCNITSMFGRSPRTKCTNQVLNELETIYASGWRGGVFFVDDNFICRKKCLKDDLLPALVEWMKARKYPFRFQTQASIDIAGDDDLLKLFVDAGFQAVFVGIESPDEDSLLECGKTQNTRIDLIGSVRKLQAAGLQVQAGFIVGFDNDKSSIFKDMAQFVNESGLVVSMVGLLNAMPGTELYRRLKRENRIIKSESGDNTNFTMNFKPIMDYDSLLRGYRKLINDIYSPDAYYKRLKTFLLNYKCSTKFEFKRRFSMESIRALFMTFYKIGLKPGMRRQFWPFMAWTVLKRPRAIPMAVNLAIYSYQFVNFYKVPETAGELIS